MRYLLLRNPKFISQEASAARTLLLRTRRDKEKASSDLLSRNYVLNGVGLTPGKRPIAEYLQILLKTQLVSYTMEYLEGKEHS